MTEDEKNLNVRETESEPEKVPEDAFASGASGSREKVRVRHLGRAPGSGGKRKINFNVIDIAVIVLIVALVAFLIVGLRFQDTLFRSGTRTQTIEYTVVFRDVDETFATAVKNGDSVYYVAEKQKLGTVSADVENDRSTYLSYLAPTEEGANGTAVLLTYPDRVDLTVTIRVKATYTEGKGYDVGGLRIAVGNDYAMRFPGFTGTGTCIALNNDLS